MQTYRVCFCFRRRFRLAPAEAPEVIKSLFEHYSENRYISVDNLRRFLVEIQKEQNATVEDAQAIVKSLGSYPNGLPLEAFFKYLFGDTNPPINPNRGVHHDMTAPLSHYFIHTGHNSYLTGSQLNSDCSDLPIIHALQRGVRVIDLAVWPNPTKDDVDVLHGGSLTSPVQLMKCLLSIKEHAFSASEFLVIITLEDHLTGNLQVKTAEMISETFGALLYAPGPQGLKDFPSPESLKRRIIILETNEYIEETKKEKVFKMEVAWGLEVRYSVAGILDDKDEEDTENDEVDPKSQEIQALEYRELIAIHVGKRRGELDNWLRIDPNKVRFLSISDLELEKASETLTKDTVRFTQRNLLRIYKKETRIDSNYNPFIGWIHGAQMVACNMQSHGRLLWLMHGMFRANGGCGYVKKPDILLDQNKIFDPKEKRPVETTLMVTIYMGEGWYDDFRHTYFDTYSPPDSFARIGIAGVPDDSMMKRTRIMEDSWIPTWNEKFVFPLTVPELALLQIEVHCHDISDKDEFAGQTCLPVSELREGIRAVPLHNHKGEKYRSTKLLMRFEFN